MPVTPVSGDELLAGGGVRELILLAGKDGVGKTSALLSLAKFIELTQPGAQFFVIDTENKLRSTLAGFGDDKPGNLQYYKCETINDVTNATDAIVDAHQPGDWLAVESMGRIWERAQDMGYQAISGTGKAEYMEKRRAAKGQGQNLPVTPKPDELWSIIKGAHDGAFLERLVQLDTLNVLLTTTLSRPPKDMPNRKESPERKDARIEHGIDMNMEGAPRLHYYVQTLLLLDRKDGNVNCRVLRDNNSVHDVAQREFAIESRKSFAMDWYQNCRVATS
jgi:hypothetical protein